MNNWPTKKLGEVAEFQKGKLMPNSAGEVNLCINFLHPTSRICMKNASCAIA